MQQPTVFYRKKRLFPRLETVVLSAGNYNFFSGKQPIQKTSSALPFKITK